MSQYVCTLKRLTNVNYLLQICEIQKLAKLLLELRLGHCLVVQKLDSVLLHLEAKQSRAEVRNAIKIVKAEYYILGNFQQQKAIVLNTGSEARLELRCIRLLFISHVIYSWRFKDFIQIKETTLKETIITLHCKK